MNHCVYEHKECVAASSYGFCNVSGCTAEYLQQKQNQNRPTPFNIELPSMDNGTLDDLDVDGALDVISCPNSDDLKNIIWHEFYGICYSFKYVKACEILRNFIENNRDREEKA
jgi:hypothetical protein